MLRTQKWLTARCAKLFVNDDVSIDDDNVAVDNMPFGATKVSSNSATLARQTPCDDVTCSGVWWGSLTPVAFHT